MKSIINNDKECYVCMTPLNLHRHHIFYGYANRQQSEKYGCWVYLCERHHNISDDGVHFNTPFDIVLKKHCQEKWEERFGDRNKFREAFGKSYL